MAKFLALFFMLLATVAFSEEQNARRTYIVRMNKDAMPAVFSSHQNWYASTLASVSNSRRTDEIIHIYDTVFHGFAARLTPSQASVLESNPGFVSMVPERVKQLHTTYSPHYLKLDVATSSQFPRNSKPVRDSYLWRKSWYGSDSIVGIFDTGVWPESKSFNDHKMSPVPARWKGKCEHGRGFNASLCNRKLVGARSFYRGYEATSGPINETVEYKSPRDTDGHGTHTASTAAGRYVYGASMMGFAAGTARGMAPRARVAAYKVCWSSGCFDSDILAAFDRAVADGVDIISLSVGGGAVPYYLDSIAIGSFGAMEHGVFVACSGGNEGPTDMSVTNVAPWITTIGASTMDRGFPANAVLGNGRVVKGVSLYSGLGHAVTGKGKHGHAAKGKGKHGHAAKGKSSRGGHAVDGQEVKLVYAGNAALRNDTGSTEANLCMKNSLDPKLVKGCIVLCDRGINARVEKGYNVLAAGGRGMILANTPTDGEGLVADSHLLPATAVGAREGAVVHAYVVKAGKKATARIEFMGTRFGIKPSPMVASFSSRGPSSETPEVLKPDVVAPGVNILAAWTRDVGPTGLTTDDRRVDFNIISGTSMACPHVSGLAALLRSAHPKWSPAAVRSALMTTATIVEHNEEASGNASTPFDFGSGHVDPVRAVDPGLVYDITAFDYVRFLCALNYSDHALSMVTRQSYHCDRRVNRVLDLNYPSVSVVFEQGRQERYSSVVTRTVTNVGPARSRYNATVMAPPDVHVEVSPSVLTFNKTGQQRRFTVTVVTGRTRRLVAGEIETVFGLLIWNDGHGRTVQSPIAVTKQEPF